MICKEETNKNLSNGYAGRECPHLPNSCKQVGREISHGGSWPRQEYNGVLEEEGTCEA